ncbi:MAG TPA: acetate uptake transporter [Ktedonobacteraceae bacterium]|nr:acetate uptake transporter [Ktedonobacteraceae bacterium]
MTQYPDERGGQQFPGPGERGGLPPSGPQPGGPQPGRVPPPGQRYGETPPPTGQRYNEVPPSGERRGMAQPSYQEVEREEAGAFTIANPNVLGLGMLALSIFLLGCFYASFFLPFSLLVRTAIGAILFFGGIVEILAGMWAFRRDESMPATAFTALGGFLLMLGYIFLPTGILIPLTVAGTAYVVLGIFFLAWTIFTALLLVGVVRVNSGLRATLALLTLTFLILMIGHFAYDNTVILRIGGWIAIITGIVGWVATAFALLGLADIQSPLRTPAHHEPGHHARAL